MLTRSWASFKLLTKELKVFAHSTTLNHKEEKKFQLLATSPWLAAMFFLHI
jgi:hypothetical protein